MTEDSWRQQSLTQQNWRIKIMTEDSWRQESDNTATLEDKDYD